MSKKISIIALFSMSFLLIIDSGCHDSNSFAVGVKGGTLGLGGDVTAKVLPALNVRAGYSMLDFDSREREFDDVEYKTNIDLSGISLLADWHVFEGPFRISSGLYYMNNSLQMKARPKEDVEIGDTEYTPAQAGTIKGSIDIDGLAPYIGIGWGNPFKNNSRLGFTCDFGMAFTKKPDASLTSSGTVSSEDLAIERRKMEDDLDSYKFYPVISLGLYYRF